MTYHTLREADRGNPQNDDMRFLRELPPPPPRPRPHLGDACVFWFAIAVIVGWLLAMVWRWI